MAILRLPITRTHRLCIVIGISFCFFLAELSLGFRTRSLALVADAFHYASDLIGFVVALVALFVSDREKAPEALSYGWNRAVVVGSFFNGVFMLALGLSIFLQSIDRFIAVEHVEDPMLVLIVAGVGLGLNIISLLILDEHDHGHDHSNELGPDGHDHDHDYDYDHNPDHDLSHSHTDIHLQESPAVANKEQPHLEHKHHSASLKPAGRDLGMLGVLTHVFGDAINNIGVMISAAIIWKTTGDARFYADPAVSMFIALMILITSLPVCRRSGHILLQGAPASLKLDDVRHDLEKIPGIESVHELHVWRLDQHKVIASVHVVVSNETVSNFMEKARTVGECLHAYGIHSATLQPELARLTRSLCDGVSSSISIEDGVVVPGESGSSACDVTAISSGAAVTISPPTLPVAGSRSIKATAMSLAMSSSPPRCQLTCAGRRCEDKTCCTKVTRKRGD